MVDLPHVGEQGGCGKQNVGLHGESTKSLVALMRSARGHTEIEKKWEKKKRSSVFTSDYTRDSNRG